MIRNYLTIGIRSLLKYKLFLFINVLGLGVAIACSIVAFLNFDFNETFDKHHRNAENVYRVQFWQEYEGQRNRYAIVPTPLGNIVRENFNDVDKVVRYTSSSADIKVNDELFSVKIAYADSSFFEFFSYTLKDGSFGDFASEHRHTV